MCCDTAMCGAQSDSVGSLVGARLPSRRGIPIQRHGSGNQDGLE
jgi:hypothetical protein